MRLEDRIKVYLASPAGQKKVNEAKAQAIKSGRTFGQPAGVVVSKLTATHAASEMKQILLDLLSENNLGSISSDDIIVSDPEISKSGEFEVKIWFDPSSLHRDSLDPYRFPDGVDNIVRLISHGWDTQGGRVSGIWHGEYTWNKVSSSSNPFMQEAVDQFNLLNLGTATLNEKYVT